MSILWTILIGFVAGILAKLIHPGPNEPSGFILTTLLGIAGAFVATYLGQAVGWYRPDEAAGLIGATVGALIVLLCGASLLDARLLEASDNAGASIHRLIAAEGRLLRVMRRLGWLGPTRRTGSTLGLGGFRFLRFRLCFGRLANRRAGGFRLRLELDVAPGGGALGGFALGPQPFHVTDGGP